MNHRQSNSGFTLLEIVVVSVIICALAAMVTPLGVELLDAERSTRTREELQRIYTAIVGSPTAGTFGYLGDVGDYPTSLLDLVRDPGLTGWTGPYLMDVRIENDILYDPFGGPYEYFNPTTTSNVKNKLVIISRGPDRSSTFTGSANPNARANFNGVDPTGSYYAGAGNSDNIVYPHFIDNSALVEYQSLGTFSINIVDLDSNSTWPGLQPGCPGMFRVTITPEKRSGNYLRFDYSPGAGTVDLLQGTYKVRVTSTTSGNDLWTEQISIPANGRVSRNLTLPGPDSGAGSTYSLTTFNTIGYAVRLYEFGVALGAGALNSGSNAAYGSINGCAHITVRNNTTGVLLDSFVYPASGNYTIRYHTSVYNATVTNLGGVNEYVVVYRNGVLLGIVGSRGNRKSKTFANIKQSDSLTFFDGQAGSLDVAQSMPGNDHTFPY